MRVIFTGLIISAALVLATPLLAQTFDIATTYQINNDQVEPNIIVIASIEEGITISDVPYDRRIFGIYQETPILVYKDTATDSGKAIVRNGDAVVKITNFNGDVRPGDLITTSPIRGFGMRSSQSGYIVGVATSTVAPLGEITVGSQTYKTGLVNLAIRIEFAEVNQPRTLLRWLDYINAALFKNVQDPERFLSIMRYIIAGAIALVAFVLAFFAFARTVSKSVEAIGRNPLATKAIQFSIFLNLSLTIGTLIIGAILVYIILRV